MPTRKQRRRQEKLRRHEWEEVWVDDEGHEVEPEPAAVAAPKRDAKQNGAVRAAAKRPTQQRGGKGRPVREIPPPSWQRVLKRSAIFLPLMFVVITVMNKGASPAGRVLVALFYALLLIPFMYLMDRTTYRAYLRRTGRAAPSEPRIRGRKR